MMGIIGRNVCEKLFHMQLQRTEQGGEVSIPPGQSRQPRRTIIESRGGGGGRGWERGAAAGSGTPMRGPCGDKNPRWAEMTLARAAVKRSTRSVTAPLAGV